MTPMRCGRRAACCRWQRKEQATTLLLRCNMSTLRAEKRSDSAFLEVETQVFASYSLEPRTRQLELEKPAITLRAIELDSGEPALFLRGGGVCPSNCASLMSRLTSLPKIAIHMPGHPGSCGVASCGAHPHRWHTDP